MKKHLAYFFLLLLTACQTKPVHTKSSTLSAGGSAGAQSPQATVRTNPDGSPLENKNYIFEETDGENGKEPNQPMAGGVGPQSKNQNIKIGLILGPGSARAYAHIGVLQELQRQKIPIHAIVGVEFAAPMAALFAWKGFANDVEWQMFKMKDENLGSAGLLSTSSTSAQMDDIKDFMKTVFHGLKTDDLKKPFSCPSLNMSKNQMFMLSRGSLEQMLPYCMPYAPVFKPFSQSVAGVYDIKAMSDYLKSQGANHILLINVLGGSLYKKSNLQSESSAFVSWAELAAMYTKPGGGVDTVITLNLDGYGLNDMGLKREIKSKAVDLSAGQIKNFAERMGL